MLDKLDKLQKEYLCLLELSPHGGVEAARRYEMEGILLDQTNGEIERLEGEIPKLKEKLSAQGFDVEYCLDQEE